MTRKSKRELALRHNGRRGARVRGWEEVNFTALAQRLGLSRRHVADALTGRGNCTVGLLERAGAVLGMTLAEVVERRNRRI